ncbi:MAG: protein-methionine-sulfoxide reductase catalytic subunit MsrP [SAR116 cluster bacterium]|nr:protein-methionine-sulfoxide reductase catalytic subunit MsrP [SAR116 cluster bacterium]
MKFKSNYQENSITPSKVFFERRKTLKKIFLIGSSILLPSNYRLAFANILDNVEKNENFINTRPLTLEKYATTYNNFYEFGSSKNIWRSAQKLETNPWLVSIDGLVEKPLIIEAKELVELMGPIEERIYRHRCVEAWAMTLPWSGFEFSKIIEYVQPLNNAKYVQFETFLDPKIARGQKQKWYPWPYTEGLTIQEASNTLTFMATGLYGKELPKQNGAPFRLVLPWKYGFKSIKSIKKITFTDRKPISFWENLQPSEYGFWANVNPNIPHARWSQENEKLIGDDIKVVPTQIFNGYGEYVEHLYNNEKKYYF